jgi:hypothetical protein
MADLDAIFSDRAEKEDTVSDKTALLGCYIEAL